MSKSFAYDINQEVESEEVIDANCLVDFRPSKDWDGTQYGFDWMRNTDISYSRNRYMHTYRGGVGVSNNKKYRDTEESDLNQWDVKFNSDSNKYNRLTKDYNMVRAPHFPDPDLSESVASVRPYCCSWLALFPSKIYPWSYENDPAKKLDPKDKDQVTESKYPNTSADLQLFITLADDNAPDYLKFEQHNCLKFTPERISAKGMKKGKQTPVQVTVNCERGFTSDQVVRIHAFKDGKKKLAGKMFVFANNQSKLKNATVKIQIVNVKSPKIDGVKISGRDENQQKYISQYLRQALITCEFPPTIDLNIENDPDFNAYFVNEGEINHDKSFGLARALRWIYKTYEYKPLPEYLYDRLIEDKGNGFASDSILFFNMGTECGNGNTAGYRSGDNIIMYKGSDNEGIKAIVKANYAHEVLHVLKLSHSFANKAASEARGLRADWTYRPLHTDNIMDYTHMCGFPRYALWHWQWKVARANTKIKR